MDDAQSRQRGPPPPTDERSSSSRAPPGGSQREHWQREDSRWAPTTPSRRSEMVAEDSNVPFSHAWRSRAPLEDERFASKKPWLNGSGNGGGLSTSSSASAAATGGQAWQTGDTDWERTSRRERLKEQERSYGRPAGPSGAGSSSLAAGGLMERSSNGAPPYRRQAHAQRSRSQSPPGPSTSSSTLPYSSAPPRQRYEQQSSPPKRPWQSRDSRESLPPSSSYTDTPPPWDRNGPHRGPRGGPWSDRRSNGAVGSHSTPYPNDRFASRSARDGRNNFEEPLDRRPLDNSWTRQPKPHGYAPAFTALAPARLTAPHSSDTNGWRDDKGKGPAYEYDDRRPSFSRNNQNNPPSSLNESRGRSPESIRSRERRSPSYDDFAVRSPASSTNSHSRLSDRIPPEYERQRNFPQPRLSAPPKQSHPPLNRSSSAGQPAPKRDFEFPPDRPPDDSDTRPGRSASVSQEHYFQNGNRSWPVRRRSLSATPPRHVEETKDQTSPRSLAERLGPLASVTKELQDRIEPIVFRARTPPLKSPVRQSAPSTLQRNRSPLPQPTSTAPQPIVRSFTPPLPSPARRAPQPSNGIEISPKPAKDTSPSPKLGSSPSDAANSSPRPSTTDLDLASSEFTQGRTSPDVSKDDESMQEEERPEDGSKPMIAGDTDGCQKEALVSLERMPRAPIPLRSTETVSVGIAPVVQDSTADSSFSERLPSTRSQLTDEEAHPQVAPGASQTQNSTDSTVIVAKVEVVEANMEVEDSTVSADKSLLFQDAGTSDSSIVVRDIAMETDQPEALNQSARENSQEEQDNANEEISLHDEDAREENPKAKEFAKSLLSFIETTDPDEEDASVDLSTILEDNKLKAPISLPLAVNMPEDGQDPFGINQILLSNHNILDCWLQDNMAARDKRRGEKIFRLRQRYKELDAEWHVHCHRLEKLRERQKSRQNIPIAPPTPSVDSTGISIVPTTPSLLAPSGRSNRRSATSSIGYGDAVRSEAEFLEILASLEDADMRDPNLRAMRTTATVPDQIIDESEYTLQQYEDNNGLVTDPFEHYTINKSPDSWTEEEIAIFCRRYALYPKQFGKIAAALPDKSTNQCVLFYYRSKKKIDFRALVDRKNRDGRRKRAKGEKGDGSGAAGKKGPSLLNNIERARGGEVEDEDDDEPQTPGSAMAQESTVLSTARALTQQINGTTDGLGRSEAGKRPPAGRSASNKKAARFMSPSAERSATDDGVPPSDGVLAAAEALGFLSNIPTEDPDDPNSRPNSAKQKKRKPSMSDSIMNTSFGDDGTPRPINSAKRSRPHSSSYWSVADKNEFMRLLSLHGKNYVAISKGIQSKTAVQCKNFFQNNTKKMGLAEIASRAEGEFANISGEIGPDSPMGGTEMPSVFGEPDGIHLQEPPSGYFIPSHRGNSRDPEEHKPSARSGGMHLRNLLDDAPDAEGGAHSQAVDEVRMPADDDSATEDEAEPARYAQESVDARGALRQAHAERAAAQQRQASRAVKDEMMAAESVNQRGHPGEDAYYPPHMRSASFGSRSDFPEAGQYSPTYHSMHHNERGYTMPPRNMYSNTANGHYEPAQPQNGHWSPYEGRSIYGPPSGSGYYQRPRHEEQVPASYYRHEQHHSAYLDSPAHDKGIHRTAYPPRPQHNSPFYNGGGQSPPQHGNHHHRRPSEPRGPDTDATYYERYGASRAP